MHRDAVAHSPKTSIGTYAAQNAIIESLGAKSIGFGFESWYNSVDGI